MSVNWTDRAACDIVPLRPRPLPEPEGDTADVMPWRRALVWGAVTFLASYGALQLAGNFLSAVAALLPLGSRWS